MFNIFKLILLLCIVSNLLSKDLDDAELIFIYNAKSGFINELVDFAHKINVRVMIRRFEYHSLSIEAVKQLKPDYIRLARDIGQGVATDERKHNFVLTMQEISSLLGVAILAENVTTERDLNILKSIQITGASH
mgnify:CR=1 FL=1